MTDQPVTDQPAGTETGIEPLLVSQHVAAPPETVFDFLVEPDKVIRWLGAAIDIEAKPGGVFWMDANGTDIASGHYHEVVRPDRVVFTFGWEASPHVPAGSTTVTITLEAMGDGTTTVHLRHDGLPKGPADDHRHGWTHYLGRLAELFNPTASGT
ncbi:MAG: SRPBCC domain-containing protein [Actinomycetota bacterium]